VIHHKPSKFNDCLLSGHSCIPPTLIPEKSVLLPLAFVDCDQSIVFLSERLVDMHKTTLQPQLQAAGAFCTSWLDMRPVPNASAAAHLFVDCSNHAFFRAHRSTRPLLFSGPKIAQEIKIDSGDVSVFSRQVFSNADISEP
jgi:hypothetical protein